MPPPPRFLPGAGFGLGFGFSAALWSSPRRIRRRSPSRRQPLGNLLPSSSTTRFVNSSPVPRPPPPLLRRRRREFGPALTDFIHRSRRFGLAGTAAAPPPPPPPRVPWTCVSSRLLRRALFRLGLATPWAFAASPVRDPDPPAGAGSASAVVVVIGAEIDHARAPPRCA